MTFHKPQAFEKNIENWKRARQNLPSTLFLEKLSVQWRNLPSKYISGQDNSNSCISLNHLSLTTCLRRIRQRHKELQKATCRPQVWLPTELNCVKKWRRKNLFTNKTYELWKCSDRLNLWTTIMAFTVQLFVRCSLSYFFLILSLFVKQIWDSVKS